MRTRIRQDGRQERMCGGEGFVPVETTGAGGWRGAGGGWCRQGQRGVLGRPGPGTSAGGKAHGARGRDRRSKEIGRVFSLVVRG